jgi:hypothetical protein
LRFNVNYGVLGALDELHGTNASFKIAERVHADEKASSSYPRRYAADGSRE